VDYVWIGVFLLFAAGPGMAALIVMNRPGQKWAKARIVTYSVCSVLYGLNALLLMADGIPGPMFMSGVIAFQAGRGALRARRAYRGGDYRTAAERAAAPKLNEADHKAV
jgi:hypothetical protein